MKHLLLAIGLSALVAACGTTPEDARMQAKESGMAQVTGAETLEQVFAGNTYYTTGTENGAAWEFAALYKADGTAHGRTWWDGGEKTGNAAWGAEGDLFCSKWDNDWGGGDKSCFEVYKDGQKIMFVRVSGSGDTIGEGELKPGNPYEL